MKLLIKKIGFLFIIVWLIGVVYRLFFEKPLAGMQQYTYNDAFIDGSLLVGLLLLIVSAFIKKTNESSSVEEKAMKGKNEFQQLIEALNDSEKRWDAISALGDKGDKRAIDPLRNYTTDLDPQIRGAAVIALGKIGGEGVVETLIEVLKQEEGVMIRQFAIDALGDIGDKKAVPVIQQAYIDQDPSIKKHAQAALEKLGVSSFAKEKTDEINVQDSTINASQTNITNISYGEDIKELLVEGNYLGRDDQRFPYLGVAYVEWEGKPPLHSSVRLSFSCHECNTSVIYEQSSEVTGMWGSYETCPSCGVMIEISCWRAWDVGFRPGLFVIAMPGTRTKGVRAQSIELHIQEIRESESK